jgi:hypothetical protein
MHAGDARLRRRLEGGQDLRHARDRRVDIINRGCEAEAEAHPIAAMIGMNISRCECSFDRRRMRRAEAEKIAVSRIIIERRDEVALRQSFQA